MDDLDGDPPDEFHFPLVFTWALPPLPHGPDLLVLATELAGIGGTRLPLEVSAIDSFPSVTDAPERSLTVNGRLAGLPRPHLQQRGGALRRARRLPGRQPLPRRAGAGLAGRGPLSASPAGGQGSPTAAMRARSSAAISSLA